MLTPRALIACRDRQIAPARRAQPILLGDGITAQRATRRKHQIDQRSERVAQEGSGRHCPKLDRLPASGKTGTATHMEQPAVPRIFSHARRRMRWNRAAARQAVQRSPAEFLFETFAEEIGDRLGFIRHEATTGLLIGDPTGHTARVLAPHIRHLTRAGPSEIDADAMLPRHFDLIASLGLLDTVNDVPGALLHIRHALTRDGLAIIGLTGAGSLPALREAMLAAEPDRTAARIHPMIDIQAAAALMQRAGFSRQVADHFPLKVRYGSFDRLIADLRDQGLTGVLTNSPPPLGKAALARARAAFMARADADGKVTETFEFIILTGWG